MAFKRKVSSTDDVKLIPVPRAESPQEKTVHHCSMIPVPCAESPQEQHASAPRFRRSMEALFFQSNHFGGVHDSKFGARKRCFFFTMNQREERGQATLRSVGTPSKDTIAGHHALHLNEKIVTCDQLVTQQHTFVCLDLQ
jgi:hypothetical protein